MKATVKKPAIVITDKEILKAISKVSHYDVERFIYDANRYIKAIADRRMYCIIKSVSSSGMSRVMKFGEYNNGFMNFFCFLSVMGYKETKRGDGFRVNGCGMDMVFATNYNIIGQLRRLGFLDKATADKLAQETPVVL